MANLSRRFHIIIDARNCDGNLITDMARIGKAIRDIAGLCEMKILHGPVVVEGVSSNPGLTGFAIIDFSHISVHTFSDTNEICIDIFSCKSFNSGAVKDYVKKAFNLDESSTKITDVKHED